MKPTSTLVQMDQKKPSALKSPTKLWKVPQMTRWPRSHSPYASA